MRVCMERRRWTDYRGEVVTMVLTWCGIEKVVEDDPPDEMSRLDKINKACRECLREELNELAKNEE